jgi:hypothetical protein
MPPTPSFTKEVTVNMKTLLRTTTDPAHQADAARRDQAFEEAICNQEIHILPRPQVLEVQTIEQGNNLIVQDDSGYKSAKSTESPLKTRKPIGRCSFQIDQQENLQKMDQELQGRIISTKPTAKRTKPKMAAANLASIDICLIGAMGFNRTLNWPSVTPFITSLYKIDWIIKEKEIEEIQREADKDKLTNEELIDQKLLPQHHDFRDVFSKAESDTLALYCPYDLKIKLEKNQDLGFSPL